MFCFDNSFLESFKSFVVMVRVLDVEVEVGGASISKTKSLSLRRVFV